MKEQASRENYFYFKSITTRWADNDIYGHVNNVAYYSYFDTVANCYLIEEGGLDIHNAQDVGFVVASSCEYYSPISYPQSLEVAFRVNRLGSKSVEYGLAIFKQNDPEACASGTFTHVFVNRESGKSTSIPGKIRQALTLALIE